MNNQIQNAYINALLADAAYVDADLLATDLPKRMTPTLAAYITANFEAVSSINTSDIPLLGSGFDATVWRGRADGDFAGQVFVSMRGTEVFPGADLLADGDLALASGARYQITDMINWWLRETTPVGQMAKQIKWDEFRRTDPNPLSNAVDPGFVFDTSVAGTEHLVGVTNVQVDGHSLGGHLATAFARIFGANNATTGSANVQAVSTYNSAGFNGSSTEALFQTIQTLLGTGINSFAPISAKQTNFFGQNGVEVTTNTWWFNQMGQRVGLYQEDDLAGGVNPFTNHFMYKQTDLLALGAALEKLDSTYTFAKLNTLVKAGSNVMAASYEGVLDGLRRIFQGNSIASTQPGDVSDSGPSRVDYQTNIDQLLKSVAFKSLIGKATVELADSTLASQAKTDFSAFLSLQTLSPIYLKTDTTGQAILKQANEGLAQQWEADQSLTPAQRVAGLSNFSDAYLLDRQAMLQALIAINKVDGSYDDPIRGVLLANYTYTDLTSGQVIKFKGTASDANVQESQQVIFGNNQDNSLIGSDSVAFGLGDRLYGGGGNDSIDAKSGDDYLEGNAGDDNLLGGDGNDVLLGCAGNDFLNGEAGNDQLQGGTGTDTYLFSGTWGKDTIVDSDGSGSLKIDGYTLSSGQTIVDADGSVVWAQKLPNGQIIHYRVLDSSSSNTSKQLVITKESDSANTITVNNFDQSQAFGDGYLGIQLSTSPKIAVVDRSSQTQTSSGSFWRDLQADIASLVGKVSTFAEGNGKFFTLFLNTPAGLGATAVLSLAGLAGRSIKAVLGDQTVDADGATISLAEGQTQVTFALIQDGPLDADALGSFKVTYQSQGQSAESNAWGLDIKDAGESTSTVTGDFIKSSAGGSYLITNNNYVSAGAQPDSPDVLNGGDDRETLLGKGGNDGLYGGDGADSLDGGTGDDLLLGGTGADTLNGGDGNDIIFGSAVGGINTPTSTTFTLPDVPANSQAVARGFSWMATRALPAGGDTSVTFRPLAITGAIASPGWLDSAGQQFVEVEGNVIDGGAGDDYIAAGTNDDRVEGGDGNDVILGMDHSDLLMGDAGDDFILGDGTQGNDPTTFTPLERHGADFIDGGEGNDVMLGQGGDDVLYGGDGNDQAWGDGALDNNDQASKAVEFQGNDYLDGEDGDDSLTGGGKDDTLYGGTGNDKLWGDGGHAGEVLLAAQGNDYLDGEEGDDYLAGGGSNDQLFGGDGNDTMLGDDQQSVLPVSAHGDDYMDGEDGNDLMAGGGGNDTLYGGTGNDQMQGDDLGSNVAASAHGNDYLDGEAGDDTLIGGGKDDTLYGGEGADLLRGDDRGDAVAGTFHGADYLDGEAGNDTLIGDGGADTLYGGDGNDALSGDDSGNIVAGAFHGADYLDGEAGNDTLRGGGGADTLYGGDGDDVVAGDDDLSLLAAEFHGDDVLDGGNGNDQLIGGGGNDQLAGGAGDDILVGDAGDTVTGVNGNDVLDGGDGADALLGNGGNDQLAGGAGNDTLLGGAGDDYLDGGTGVNYLFGGAGNDTLVGSAADYLEGGAGDDTFIVSGDGTSIPSIYDSRGHNTLTLDGSAQEYTPYTSDGMTYLVSGGQAAVALADGTDLGGMSVDDGADGKTVFQLAQSADPSGRIHSAAVVNGQWVSTSQINTNQILQAGSTAAALDGGAGDDQLDGGIGSDSLAGGAGRDLLTGGAGADVLNGGVGNDILMAGGADADDNSADVYQFDTGDGADFIAAPASAGDGVARDVISFGQGVDVASVRFAASVWADLVISYGSGDTITLARGAFADIAEIRFADGSHLSRADVLQRLTPADGPAVGGDSQSNANLLLVGGASADQLTGGAGDDTLVGGRGNDGLAGGQGRNTYVFGSDSGADRIVPSDPDGKVQVLQFTQTALAGLRVFMDGQDVVVQQASDAFVRVVNLGSDAQDREAWQVVDSAGQQSSIAQLLVSNAPEQFVDLDQRRADFMRRQQMQLRSTPQRLYPLGDAHWIASVPTTVSVVEHAAGHYLQTNESDQIITTYESTPVYETRTIHSPGTPARVISSASVGGNTGVQLPSGAVPMFGPSSVGATSPMGFLVPAEPAHDTQVQSLVGWTLTPVEHHTLVLNDSATQFVYTGTTRNDSLDFYGGSAGLPTLFRGSIAMGDGDDNVTLGTGRTWGNGDDASDWLPSFFGEGVYFGDAASFDIDHGLGAWIDMGDGNDVVFGSDGNDFIIGGAGNNVMDGQAGADTYYVSFRPGEVDYIGDSASVPISKFQDAVDEGRRIAPPNYDTVEFDSTVALSSLSYRWDGGPVQLFVNGELFLDIAVGTVGWGTAGIEWVRFADGTGVALSDLLDSIPEQAADEIPSDNHAPTLSQLLVAPQAHEDQVWTFVIPAGTFTDADAGDRLSYSATLANGDNLPSWLTFHGAARAFSGRPATGDIGTVTLKVTATDAAGASVSSTFDLNVVHVNHAPVVSQPLVAQQATEDQVWSFTVPVGTFTDADTGDTLTYTATLASGAALPSWVSFNAATRTFSGTPLNADVGQLNLKVTATDTAGAAGSSTFGMTIVNANDPPTVSQPLVAQQATENEVWSFTVPAGTFTDVDAGDTLSYSATLASGDALPSWVSFDVATHTFSGTPLNTDAGTLSLSVTAVDRAGATAWQVFTLTVAAPIEHAIVGTADADNLVGGPDADRIDGLAGADTMSGGGGNDTLTGGTGNDTLIGGTGNDVYTFSVGDGSDVIQDTDATSGNVDTLVFDSSIHWWSMGRDAADLVISYGAAGASDEIRVKDWAALHGAMVVKVNFPNGTTYDVADYIGTNRAPYPSYTVGTQLAPVDAPWTLTFSENTFTDQDGDSLTYSAATEDGAALPAWLSFDPQTRTFAGTPGVQDLGTLILVVTATDSFGGSGLAGFALNVADASSNHAPVAVASLQDQTTPSNEYWSYSAYDNFFADQDVAAGDHMTFSASLGDGSPLPDWLHFQGFWGQPAFWGSPPEEGSMTVSFTATDVFGATAHTDFLLTVGGDHAPVINGAMGRSHATPDEPWTFTVPDNVFVDPDVGDTLTYAVDTLPSWISFDPATRTFHGTASEADAGVTTIVVTATDQLGRSSSGAYLELHISHGVWVTGSGILQGSSSSDDWLTATGSNTQLFGGAGDDVLAAGHPQEFGVLDNLVFVGGPGDDYLYRSYGSNYYQFNIGDGHDQIDWEFFPATGAEGGEDWLQFGLGITPQDITVTGDYELTFTVGNGDDSVNVADWFYDADGGEDEGGTFFKIEHVTFADGTQWGIADVEAIAAAGGHVNPDNLAPLLTTPLDDQSADAGTQWSFAIPAGRFSDPDGDTLSYHATLGNGDPLPAWLTFNPATRGFEGTPPSGTPNLSLKLTAIDTSGARVSGVFTLDIVAGNTAPVVANPLTAKATGEDAAWTFTVPAGTFTDADAADTLTYSATLANGNALPAWLGFNAATRTFTGTPQNGDVGGLSLKVTATDSAGAAASSTFALTIANVNDAPTVAQTIVNQAATEEQPWSYAVSADTFTDMDAGDTLSYTAMLADGTALPPWLSFSAATGTFNGTPRNGDVGTLSLKVRAVDLAGATASTGFDLTVANVNDAPTVSQSIANQSINEDQSFSFTVPAATFADVDAGDTLTYSASLAGGAALPSWLAFDASTLSFGGTPAAADLGNLNLELTATDSAGATANTSFGLNVAHVNHAPVVAQVLSGQEAVATQAWTYTVPAGAFTDPDTGDTLTYGATLTNGNALPAWLAFSAATRTFSGTPGSTDAGLVALQVVATDAAGATASQSFNLGVSSIPGLTVVGTSAANTLTGGAGDDRIDGLGGADTMRGLGGNDTYVVDNAKDVVVEAADQGYDRIESSVTYTVPANVEAITLTGAAGIGATGNALNNELVGNSGGNKLDGGVGADRMLGGLGNDTYVVDNPGDLVVELAAEGTDTVHSSVSYTLPGNAENLTLIGAESLAATGNDQNNTITANAAGSVLSGLDGNDTLRGAGGADTLYGGAGNDRLDGGAAADQMFGGAGNDTYVADNAGDVAIEQAGDGTDTVQSSVSHTLGANIENLTLTGTASMVATGNDLNNIITANAAASVLSGLGGNDTLRGGAAADILYGGDGNDRLDGREAADQLFGGAGNDTYVVDDAGDTVTEQAGEGTDIVQSSVSYTLGANIENLTLTGTASLAGTGNDLSNTLTANATGGTLWGMAGNDTLRGAAGADILYGGEGNDRMDGLAGADQLIGGAGNDTYVVGDAGDAVTELAGEGTDIVQSSVSYTLSSNVENLTLTGSAAIDGTGNEQANIITGNGAANALHGLGGNDTINGGAANDTLEGGRGDDRLNGGSGADTYLFGRGDGVDTLTDVEATAGVQDMLQFGSGIAADQLWLRKVANNLEVSVIGTTDKVTITGWYTDAAHHVETLQLAGGQRLMDSQVQNLVQAMASFAPPAVGQTTLPQSYSSLEGVIAANWQ